MRANAEREKQIRALAPADGSDLAFLLDALDRARRNGLNKEAKNERQRAQIQRSYGQVEQRNERIAELGGDRDERPTRTLGALRTALVTALTSGEPLTLDDALALTASLGDHDTTHDGQYVTVTAVIPAPEGTDPCAILRKALPDTLFTGHQKGLTSEALALGANPQDWTE